MRSELILALYLTDQLLSAILPFSSGSFAILLIGICIIRVNFTIGILCRMLIFSIATLGAGLAGALLSSTPITMLFVTTVALLAGMFAVGAGLKTGDSILITPRYAFVGVLTSSGLLLFSVFGWDAMSVVQGTQMNRGSGLYNEPSHYALFVMPLWLIAFQRKHYRPWLFIALAIAVMTCFSITLVALSICALLMKLYLHTSRKRYSFYMLARDLIVATALVTFAYSVSEFIHINDDSVLIYVISRLNGLFNPQDAQAYNLSSLVVLQGIELAQSSFVQSLGLGVGLGNFGTSELIIDQSTYRLLIHSITSGVDLNLRDGALLANKLVGELGILAILLPLLLLRYIRCLKSQLNSAQLNYHISFAVVLICLIFVRGLPYFSAPVCLAVFSLVNLLERDLKLPKHSENSTIPSVINKIK